MSKETGAPVSGRLAPSVRPRYLPADDTHLLKQAVASSRGGSCLEIGFGSGGVLASVSGRFRLAVGTDVMGLADARLARSLSVDLVLADRARCFRDGVFDLVFFNPPYLPSERIEDVTVDGGREGTEVPLSFLQEALRVMRKEGTALVLLSSDGGVNSFVEHCKEIGLSIEPVEERKLFYERLVVFKMRRRS